MSTNEEQQEPTIGETLGAMVGKILGEIEKLGIETDATRVGELRSEIEGMLSRADVAANTRAAALAAELVRELKAEPLLLGMVSERLQHELGERLELDDAEAPTARLEGEG